MENGRMPTIMIRPFEYACGCNYVTQHIAATAGFILVRIPTGKKPSKDELLNLQTGFNDALNKLVTFYETHENCDEVIGALDDTLTKIASHKLNVTKAIQPEFEL